MNISIRPLLYILGASALGVSAGCDSAPGAEPSPDPLTTTVASDIAADPIVGFVDGRPVGAGLITYFSLRTNSVVADSASTDWDIAFQATALYVNGGTSGPGAGGAMILEALFGEVTEAPADGYSTDSSEGLAIPAGSGNGWYNYNPASNLITPIPGRVLVIRTANGQFAKVRILSYYQGAPDQVTAESVGRYYTFEFVLQPNGTRIF
jgi:HmuY protein